MEVREATPADAPAVREVHRESILELGRHAYTDEQVEAWAAGCEDADYEAGIEDDDLYYVVAEADGSGDGTAGVDGVAAFGTLSPSPPGSPEADAEVTAVYVHPGVAREGVGSAVLARLEREARDRGFGSLGLTASRNAVPFYEAHGYERVRERSHEFSAHLDSGVEGTVVEMRKELPADPVAGSP